MKKSVVIIAGPTGSGESTVTKELLKRFTNTTRLVTATTRLPRNGEVDEVDYYFWSKERFLNEIELGNILEHTYVPNRDVYYGSHKDDLEKRITDEKIVIVNPDVVGAKFYKEHYNATTIFVTVESIDVLEERLKSRDKDITKEELMMRLESAQKEIDNEQDFYDHVVINSDGKLDKTMENIITILQAEGYNFEA